jgi:glycosyltransferase involved in cell wall biosynthesis
VLQPHSPAAERFKRSGIPVFEIPMHGELDLPAAERIARVARAGRFNVLHAHTAHTHMLALLATYLWPGGCRVVAHRRIEFPVGRSLCGLGALKYRQGVHAYIAISNRVKETLVEAGVPEWRVFVVRSVTDPDRFMNASVESGLRRRLGVPEDAFVVGNIAALVGHKDHRTLLEACRIVRDAVPETWLVIVGKGPLRDRIASKARKMKMADQMVMTGFRRDIPQLIRLFDVFALSSSEEGLCSTLLEVAAGGCPIVATDAGGVREAVLPDQTGLIVPTRCPRALARGIIELRENTEKGRHFAERGRRRVRRDFNPDVLTRKTLVVYRRVLAGRIGPRHAVGYCRE